MPEATGKGVLFGLLWAAVFEAVADHRADEEQQTQVPLERPRQAESGGRRNPVFDTSERRFARSGRMMPTRPPITMDQTFTRVE